MNTYRITSPNGHSGTCEMNAAAVESYTTGAHAAAGWTIEHIGPSRVIIVND